MSLPADYARFAAQHLCTIGDLVLPYPTLVDGLTRLVRQGGDMGRTASSLGAGIAATVYAAYRVSTSTRGKAGWRALVPQLLLVALLVAINVYMFTQPMAHRA